LRPGVAFPFAAVLVDHDHVDLLLVMTYPICIVGRLDERVDHLWTVWASNNGCVVQVHYYREAFSLKACPWWSARCIGGGGRDHLVREAAFQNPTAVVHHIGIPGPEEA